jgi:uncharacterized membrane protein
MTDWATFALAMSAFLGSHFAPRIGGLRQTLIARLGRRVYFSAYGVLSLALLAWVILAAGRAPYVELWPQAPWMRWLANLVVPVAFVLASCGMGVANANTLGGARKKEFDATNPGFAAISRHPLLMALLLWALAHLVVNGDLAHVIVFGSFAAFPLLAMWGFDKKTARLLGAKSAVLFAHSAWFSLAPLCNTGWWRKNLRALCLRGAIGLLCWAAALHLHEAVIGVWPFP